MGVGMISIFIVFGLLYWVGMARLVRGSDSFDQTGRFRPSPLRRAVPLVFWIIWKHLLP